MHAKRPTIIGSTFILLEGDDEESSSSLSDDPQRPLVVKNSVFENLEPVLSVEDEELIEKRFADDLSHRKINLATLQYRTEEGLPWSLPTVRKTVSKVTKELVINDACMSPFGLETFRSVTTSFLLGKFSSGILESRAFSIQTISGVNALRLGAEFLRLYLHYDTVYYTGQCTRYREIFHHARFKYLFEYHYWDHDRRRLDFEGILADLKSAPESSVVILQVWGHKPTGEDLSHEQWMRLADVIRANHLFPFFDCSAQGIASGDLDEDAWPVRYFCEERIEFFCAQAFTKMFGIYNERVGNLTVCVKESEYACLVKTIFETIIKSMHSNPPQFGARIVATILGDNAKRREWANCLRKLSQRLRNVRSNLRARLEQMQTPGSWMHITNQRGVWCMTGLTKNQIEYLNVQYSIYMPEDGHMNISVLNSSNIAYVAAAFNDAVVKFPLETLNSSECKLYAADEHERGVEDRKAYRNLSKELG